MRKFKEGDILNSIYTDVVIKFISYVDKDVFHGVIVGKRKTNSLFKSILPINYESRSFIISNFVLQNRYSFKKLKII